MKKQIHNVFEDIKMDDQLDSLQNKEEQSSSESQSSSSSSTKNT